jgi:hypothetical protein
MIETYTNLILPDALFGFRFGITNSGTPIFSGGLKSVSRKEYLNLAGKKTEETGRNCVTRSFITCSS